MIGHYLKVFFHNLLRQKAITLINISGLAIGMAVFMLVSLYVVEEFSHEKRWDRADRIFRSVSTLRFNAESFIELGSGSPRAREALQAFFPGQIETGSRVFPTGQSIVIDQETVQGGVNFVDPEILDIFDFEEVQGSLAATLATPGLLALEEERARTLFPGEALGRSLVLRLEDGSERDLRVSALYRLPAGKGKLEFSSLSLLVGDLVPDFQALLLITVVTLLGGMYPAFVLAASRPERALKAGGGTSRAANRLTGSIQMTSLTWERGSGVSVELHTYGVGYDGQTDYALHEIIGVVADSQFDNLRTAPRSEMFRLSGTSNLLLSFRVEAAAMDTIREALEGVWREVVGVGSPMIMFGSSIVAEQFGQEEKEGRLLAGFALLPICLLASLVVIGIAGSTLGLTVLRACRVKPALLLRYE